MKLEEVNARPLPFFFNLKGESSWLTKRRDIAAWRLIAFVLCAGGPDNIRTRIETPFLKTTHPIRSHSVMNAENEQVFLTLM